MESPLASFSNEIASLADRAGPSVVAVTGGRRSHASGVHWRQGLVVTAEHALRRDEDIGVAAHGGSAESATLVGRDPGTDIALLKAGALKAPVAQVAAGATPRVGDLTLVIGRSPDSGANASLGIISAVSGPWRTWRGGELDRYVRLDAEVFAGSAGGAVIDIRGNVTGMATDALSRVAGLSVPASTVERVIDQILKRGSVPQAYLGLGLQPVSVPAAFQKSLGITSARGIMVLEVESGGPADRGGILTGDIVLAVDGKETGSIEDVQSALGWEKAGATARLKLIRGGALSEVALTVGERAARGSR